MLQSMFQTHRVRCPKCNSNLTPSDKPGILECPNEECGYSARFVLNRNDPMNKEQPSNDANFFGRYNALLVFNYFFLKSP